MGCDIHVSVQKRVNGEWVDAQEWDETDGYVQVKGGELFGGRNYALFTLLANVRGEIANPLAANRGLPDGLSAEATAFHEDNHGATYFTVAEVMAYDWQQELPRSGWVHPSEFGCFKTQGRPDSWCGMVGGGRVVHIDADRMAEIIQATAPDASKPYAFRHIQWAARNADGHEWLENIERAAGGSPYCYVEWTRPAWAQGGDLFSDGIPRTWAMGAPEDVRFIVSFDN